MADMKPRVNAPVDITSFPALGAKAITIGSPKDRWTMLFVYRGRHCPSCKRFLNKLNAEFPA